MNPQFAIPPTGTWWHIYPLGAVGAPKNLSDETTLETEPRLRQLHPWLDFAADMGFAGILLGPVFTSTSHGYDTLNHFEVDPRLGNETDLQAILDHAKYRGLAVVFDGVFNHVGRNHRMFMQANAGDELERAMFRFDGEHVYNFEGHSNLVTLNHDNPEMVDLVAAVMRYWGGRGVAGWRLDAAYAVPTAFWRKVRKQLPDHLNPWLFGEVIHGDYIQFVDDSGLDSVTQYELWKAITGSLNDVNMFELAHALKRHNAFVQRFTPVTFLGNHDTSRISSALENSSHRSHALVVLMSVAGTPFIYYGDEQGFVGTKYQREGGDDEVRQSLAAQPPRLVEADDWLGLHRHLIGWRSAQTWLRQATTDVLHLTNPAMVALTRGAAGQAVLWALNLGNEQVNVTVPGGNWQHVTGTGHLQPGEQPELQLPADSYAMWQLV